MQEGESAEEGAARRLAESIHHCEAALRLAEAEHDYGWAKPAMRQSHANLAVLFRRQGNSARAEQHDALAKQIDAEQRGAAVTASAPAGEGADEDDKDEEDGGSQQSHSDSGATAKPMMSEDHSAGAPDGSS